MVEAHRENAEHPGYAENRTNNSQVPHRSSEYTTVENLNDIEHFSNTINDFEAILNNLSELELGLKEAFLKCMSL